MNCISKGSIFEFEIIIKKSRFIANLKYVASEEEAKDFINTIKLSHKEAKHHCFAYICNNIIRRDDDGEPSGTAGQPILEVLHHHNLNNICVVITRYFGGIKLGASGLIRAYTKSVSNALDNIDLIPLQKGYAMHLQFDYSRVKIIDYFFNNQSINIVNKKFENKITYEFHISQPDLENIKTLLENIDHTMKLHQITTIYI